MVNESDLGRTGSPEPNPPEAKRVSPEGTIPNEALTKPEGERLTVESPLAGDSVSAADAPSPVSAAEATPTITEGAGDQTQPGVTLQESNGYDSSSPYGGEYNSYDGSGSGHPDTPPYSSDETSSTEASTSQAADVGSEPPAGGSSTDGQASDDSDEAGGPVKSFLEHLEDLRWMLVKSVSAVVIAMLICLMAGNYLTAFLLWPVKASERLFYHNKSEIPFVVGTNVLTRVQKEQFGGTNFWGTNQIGSLHLVPLTVGTNTYLALEPHFGKSDVPPPSMVVIKNYGPMEGIMVALKLALFGGLILASPFVFYFIAQFVLPAMKVTEKRILFVAVAYGAGLFLVGVVFCYLVVMVFTIGATVEFSNWLGFGSDEWRADEYISFVVKFMLGMGLAFELPVVILVLVKIGILDYDKLKSWRQWAIVINLVAAAFITPSGDPFTMMIVAVPMQLLYEISALVAWYWEWKARRNAKHESA
jgi:sec-independent protein translocase protein TatC